MSKLIVIGSGSGGLTAAIGLAKVGYKTTIIEKEFIGGDCTNFGCIPSKTILQEAKKLHSAYKTLGLTKDKEFAKKAAEVLQKTRSVVDDFRAHESEEWLNSNNVSLKRGHASFVSPRSIKVGDEVLEFDKCVIATGSTAVIPPIEGLEGTPYLTNKTIFDLKTPPKHLVIIGNGVIGTEMAEAFAMLGSKVTVIGRRSGILVGSDKELTDRLQLKLSKLGIAFVTGSTNSISYDKGFTISTEEGHEFKADQLLIATGRRPNIDLDLEQAGVDYDRGGVIIKPTTQTSNNNIYAIGDVASGYPNFTHFAYHMGKTVTTNLIVQKFLKVPLHISKVKRELNPAVVFTSTEFAEAGLNEQQARVKYGDKVKTYILDFKDLDRAITNSEEGAIKIITKGFFGQIIGVSILASRAGEMLPEFQDFIMNKRTVRYTGANIRPYPTYTANLDNAFKYWLGGLGKKK